MDNFNHTTKTTNRSWLEQDQKMLQRAIEEGELKEVTKDGT